MKIQSNPEASHTLSGSSSMPKLQESCFQIRREILSLSGLDEATLDEVSTELGVDYDMWCADYRGRDLADSFMGFCEMLRDWHCPWPYQNDSGLNGLTLAQFFFAWAYGNIECACWTLREQAGNSSAKGFATTYDAACSVISANNALMRAKHILGSPENCLAQQANSAQSYLM